MSHRVLITGATGFVGTHLTELLDSPDNCIYGSSFPHVPLPGALSCEGEICHMDLRNQAHVFAVMKQARPDWVFHLAAISNVRHSWERRSEALETNILGTHNVYEAVKEFAPHARVLFASSSNVYAEQDLEGRGLNEDDAIQAVSPYAFTKISGELLSRFYTEIEGLQIVIARAFPHTGPGQSPDFVCSDWARQIVCIEKGQTEPILRVGNIHVARDFTDVRDVVRAYSLLLENVDAGQVYNISSGSGITLKSILDDLLELTSVSIEVQIDQKKLRKADLPSLVGDSSKLRKATGWSPSLSLRQTLNDLLDYWRSSLDG